MKSLEQTPIHKTNEDEDQGKIQDDSKNEEKPIPETDIQIDESNTSQTPQISPINIARLEETKIESENEPSKTETFQSEQIEPEKTETGKNDNQIESTTKTIEQEDQSPLADLKPLEIKTDHPKENQNSQIGLDVTTERNENEQNKNRPFESGTDKEPKIEPRELENKPSDDSTDKGAENKQDETKDESQNENKIDTENTQIELIDQTEPQIEHPILIQDKDSESNKKWDELYEMYAIDELCDKAASNYPHFKHDIIISMFLNNPDEFDGFSEDEGERIDVWRYRANELIKQNLGQSDQQTISNE